MASTPNSSVLWYVVMTKPRQEALAIQHLVNQNYTAWAPMHASWRRKARGWDLVHSPMFPRYVFVRPGCSEQGIGSIRSTVGVTELVRFGMQPAVASEALIDALHDLEQRLSEALQADTSPLRLGDRVCVVEGPFVGMEGIVSCVADERAAVLMRILGQERTVQFSLPELDLVGA